MAFILVLYGPAASGHVPRYPMQKGTRENWGVCFVFVFFWSNISEVETVEISSGRARQSWQPCQVYHWGQQPHPSPSFIAPKCTWNNSSSAVRSLL